MTSRLRSARGFVSPHTLVAVAGLALVAAFAMGQVRLSTPSVSSAVSSAITPFLPISTSEATIRGGPLTHQFHVSQAYTDDNNQARVNILTDTGDGYATIGTETLAAGVNATGSGMCLTSNNNTQNRWCASANPAVGLRVGTTPSLIYAITTPTISSGFGTGPTIAGRASSFAVTVGSGGATTGVVAFAATFTNVPSCMANDDTTANYLHATSTTTQVTIDGTMAASDVVRVLCLGY